MFIFICVSCAADTSPCYSELRGCARWCVHAIVCGQTHTRARTCALSGARTCALASPSALAGHCWAESHALKAQPTRNGSHAHGSRQASWKATRKLRSSSPPPPHPPLGPEKRSALFPNSDLSEHSAFSSPLSHLHRRTDTTLTHTRHCCASAKESGAQPTAAPLPSRIAHDLRRSSVDLVSDVADDVEELGVGGARRALHRVADLVHLLENGIELGVVESLLHALVE